MEVLVPGINLPIKQVLRSENGSPQGPYQAGCYRGGVFLIDPDKCLHPEMKQALALSIIGLTAEEAGAFTNYAPSTVKNRRQKLSKQLGANNVVHIICRAFDQGLLDVHIPIRPKLSTLKPRQLIVLDYCSQGMTIAKIGDALNYGEPTIKKDVHDVRHQFEVNKTLSAVLVGYLSEMLPVNGAENLTGP